RRDCKNCEVARRFVHGCSTLMAPSSKGDGCWSAGVGRRPYEENTRIGRESKTAGVIYHCGGVNVERVLLVRIWSCMVVTAAAASNGGRTFSRSSAGKPARCRYIRASTSGSGNSPSRLGWPPRFFSYFASSACWNWSTDTAAGNPGEYGGKSVLGRR